MVGLIVGVVAGAVAGVLLAPRSGSENREKLVEAIPGAPDAATLASTDLKARLEEAREAFREGADQTREQMLRELAESRKAN